MSYVVKVARDSSLGFVS